MLSYNMVMLKENIAMLRLDIGRMTYNIAMLRLDIGRMNFDIARTGFLVKNFNRIGKIGFAQLPKKTPNY